MPEYLVTICAFADAKVAKRVTAANANLFMLCSLLLVLFSYLLTTLGGKGQGCQMYHTVELGRFAAPYWHMNNAIPAPCVPPPRQRWRRLATTSSFSCGIWAGSPQMNLFCGPPRIPAPIRRRNVPEC